MTKNTPMSTGEVKIYRLTICLKSIIIYLFNKINSSNNDFAIHHLRIHSRAIFRTDKFNKNAHNKLRRHLLFLQNRKFNRKSHYGDQIVKNKMKWIKYNRWTLSIVHLRIVFVKSRMPAGKEVQENIKDSKIIVHGKLEIRVAYILTIKIPMRIHQQRAEYTSTHGMYAARAYILFCE